MMKKINLSFSVLASFLLVGCSSYNEQFSCPVGSGLACHSTTGIKKKLDQGEIDLPETTTEAFQRGGGQKRGGAVHPLMTPMISASSSSSSMKPVAFETSNGMLIQRSPEKPLRVWIAPYQDREGNLRESLVVHTVVQSGYWHLSPKASA